MYNTTICFICKIEKDVSDFYKCKKNGRQSACKQCKKEISNLPHEKIRNKKWREDNHDHLLEMGRKYWSENSEVLNKAKRDSYPDNKDEICERNRIWKENNPDKANESRNNSRRKRFKSDPLFKLEYTLRCRIKAAFKANKVVNRPHTNELLGCNFEKAKKHIESLFKKGMTWENHGYGYGFWHIDHKIPLSFAKNENELKKLCHYTNLQPLWHQENLSKGDRLPTLQIPMIL